MQVAVLGTGAMGSRMAAALLRAGHSTVVWNRNAERARPLLELGATAAASPREAARDAEIVIAVVRDDGASRDTWLSPADGALAGMGPAAVGIESSTLTVGWVRELAVQFAGRGIAFLDAPVVGTRAQADSSTLIHLAGGDAETIVRVKPVLAAMGGAVHATGAVGSAAALKLIVNALLGVQVAVLAELLSAAEHMGLDRRRAGEVLAEMPSCSASAKGIIMGMLAKNFAPAFPVELVDKDLGYLDHEARPGAVPVTDAARAVFGRAIAAGFAADNMTAVAKLYDEA